MVIVGSRRVRLLNRTKLSYDMLSWIGLYANMGIPIYFWYQMYVHLWKWEFFLEIQRSRVLRVQIVKEGNQFLLCEQMYHLYYVSQVGRKKGSAAAFLTTWPGISDLGKVTSNIRILQQCFGKEGQSWEHLIFFLNFLLLFFLWKRKVLT